MKRNLYFLILLLFIIRLGTYAQTTKPFTPTRFNENLKGDILLIGNNILSAHPTNAYNTTGSAAATNDQTNMVYVDVDADASTFSSSSARLEIPTASRPCYRIKYAALYWSATNRAGNETNVSNIKFKTPGSTSYTDISGQIIYNEAVGNLLGNSCSPYAAYAEVTSLINTTSAEGEYFVANIKASLGDNDINNDNIVECPGGNAAGWSLFIVYEDPKLPRKLITSFDGFTGITGTNNLTIPISGFTTNPTGSVRAKVAFSALEGDNKITGDNIQIRGVNTTAVFSDITSVSRPSTNFFNSSFSDLNGNFTNRIPSSQNTLGYDAGVTTISNPSQSVLGNNETQAEIKLNTNGDQYYLFFLAFSVEVIEPNVILTKGVQNMAGQNIENQNITLCQELNYIIGFDNIGNDNAEGLATQPAPYGSNYVLIRDVLPNNVTLVNTDLSNIPGSIVVSNPNNPKELNFYIPKQYFVTSETSHKILIRVRVACSCLELTSACSNIVKNQAFVAYQGEISDIAITNEPSLTHFDPTCSTGIVASTNFLVDIDNCSFTSDVYLCGNSIALTAADGYTTYNWTGPVGAVIAPNNTSQTVTVNLPGTYTVTGNDTQCRPIVQTFNVLDPSTSLTNPIIAYDENAIPSICPNTGETIPSIYLCGLTDAQVLETNVSNAASIEWFRYNEETCGAYPPNNCPVTTNSCWTSLVGTGSSYTVTQSGKYSVVFSFAGGCSKTFYFNVAQNTLNPTATASDIFCNTPGTITVNNVPSMGYQFQLLSGATVASPWQSSNIFSAINSAGNYIVQVRASTFTDGCLFSIPNVTIQDRTIDTNVQLNQPECFGNFGSIRLTIYNPSSAYQFALYQGSSIAGPLISMAGPIMSNQHVFNNLTAGQTYTWKVSTAEGCSAMGTFTITNPSPLIATSLAISEDTINVVASGGTPNYQYSIDSGVTFTPSNLFFGLLPATYTIIVVDANGCTTSTIAILQPAPPIINNPTQTFPQGATLADIVVNGQNIKWYATSSENRAMTSELPLSTVLVDGTTYYVTQTVNGIESQRTAITVKVGTLSNTESSFQQLKIFPIPAQEHLQITNATLIEFVDIYTYLGTAVGHYEVASQNISLDISNLASGVYFAKLKTNEAEKTVKFIKE